MGGEVDVIRTRLYRDGKCVKENFDPAEISDHLESKDACVVWLDLDSPSQDDLALIAEEFGLNPLAVEDATSERQRPKLDHYDDHIFISLYDVGLT
ncbi:MAG TPA: CorA family divalent cation transporter, partial [Mycobacteriales bacterium]|nr:CorA family divalent cation transporter [Mycobacteriales bacterium]